MSTPLRVDGRAIAAEIERQIAASPSTTRELVGFVAAEDAAGNAFQKSKRRAAERCGIAYRIEVLPEGITQKDLLDRIAGEALDKKVAGIVVQLPLPGKLDTDVILDSIPADKDPDVLGESAYAAFIEDEGTLPPAVIAVRAILASAKFETSSKTIAVIGQGRLVGLPIADWLENRSANLLRLDKGFDEDDIRNADLVILGTGSYQLDPKKLKNGAGVIDFGYQNGSGDLDTSGPNALDHLSFYTPTPGGTGPVLIAALLQNFVRIAK